MLTLALVKGREKMNARSLLKQKAAHTSRRLSSDKDESFKLNVLAKSKGNSKNGLHLMIRCGCGCKRLLDIKRDAAPLDREFSAIEINGVYASLNEWRRHLCPTLALVEKVVVLHNGQRIKVWLNAGAT